MLPCIRPCFSFSCSFLIHSCAQFFFHFFLFSLSSFIFKSRGAHVQCSINVYPYIYHNLHDCPRQKVASVSMLSFVRPYFSHFLVRRSMRPSIGWSVGPCVCPSVNLSVGPLRRIGRICRFSAAFGGAMSLRLLKCLNGFPDHCPRPVSTRTRPSFQPCFCKNS